MSALSFLSSHYHAQSHVPGSSGQESMMFKITIPNDRYIRANPSTLATWDSFRDSAIRSVVAAKKILRFETQVRADGQVFVSIGLNTRDIDLDDITLHIAGLAKAHGEANVHVKIRHGRALPHDRLAAFMEANKKYLHTLHIENCNHEFNDAILKSLLKNCENLNSLVIGSGNITSEGLNDIQHLQHLEYLNLNYCWNLRTFTLSNLPTLQSLVIITCGNLTSLALSDLPALQGFDVDGCAHLTDLTLVDLPLLTTTSLVNACTYLSATSEIARTLFNFIKHSPNANLIEWAIDFISKKHGEDHQYVQELIHQLIFNTQDSNPKSPYVIHRRLLEKESQVVEHRPQHCDIHSIRFNISPEWIQEPPQFSHISYSYSKFIQRVDALESKLEASAQALKELESKLKTDPQAQEELVSELKTGAQAIEEFNNFFPDITIRNLKGLIDKEFYRDLLDADTAGTAAACSSSASSSSQSVRPSRDLFVTSCRLRKMLQLVEEFDKDCTPEELARLTPGDKALIQMLHNIKTCGSGKTTGVDHAFYAFAEDKVYDELLLKETGPLERITFYIKEELRRRRYNEFPLINVHNKTYSINLLGRELGLYMKGEKPKFDLNGQVIDESLRNLSKQEVLDRFYNTYTTIQVITWVEDLFNGDQIQMTDNPGEKWAIVSQTLNNTQEGDTESLLWDPLYIKFADVDHLIPIGITSLGAAMILTKMGVLTALGD